MDFLEKKKHFKKILIYPREYALSVFLLQIHLCIMLNYNLVDIWVNGDR